MFTVVNREAELTLEAEEQAGHLFAGGLMHSGHACGMLLGAALAAGARASETFRSEHESILCPELCGRFFPTINEHTEFMEQDGCRKLIEEIVTRVRKTLIG